MMHALQQCPSFEASFSDWLTGQVWVYYPPGFASGHCSIKSDCEQLFHGTPGSTDSAVCARKRAGRQPCNALYQARLPTALPTDEGKNLHGLIGHGWFSSVEVGGNGC